MIFFIESVVLCLLFALMIIPATRKNPISQLYNYPPKIIERVKSLPEYKDQLPTNETKWAKKIFGCVLFFILLGITTYLSGMRSYLEGFLYSYGLWNVVNWFDAFILDVVLFAHDKFYRFKGTEDMVKEYENPWFYLGGGVKGMVIGLPVCLLAAGVVVLIGLL